MTSKNTETFCPASVKEWRSWLSQNHISKSSIWVVFYKKNSKKPYISWSEAVDEALCFGWIDSTKKRIDDEKYMQFYSQRKPTSTWSKINKDKVKLLMEKGLMAQAGMDKVETAKQNGSWSILDAAENLTIPKDLETEFQTKPTAKDFFLSLSRSNRKSILQWIAMAKRPETRQKRIRETVDLANKNLKPKQFR